jgi:hypothetical protein
VLSGKDGERIIEGLGEATRKNVYSTLSKLFRSIYEDKLIVENPMKYVSKVKVKKQDEKDLDKRIEKVSAMMNKNTKSSRLLSFSFYNF